MRKQEPVSVVGYFLRTKAVVTEAANRIASVPGKPDPDLIAQDFERFCALSKNAPSRSYLDIFMALLRENLRQKQVVRDPLVLYMLEADIINKLNL